MNYLLIPLSIFALALCFPCVQAMANTVTLQSGDGQDFKVEAQAAKKSKTIDVLIEDFGENPIPLPQVSGKTLAKVVNFMNHPLTSERELRHYVRKDLIGKMGTPDLQDVLFAFNYLDLQILKEGDALKAVSRVYGDRLFSKVDAESYKTSLSMPEELLEIVLAESWNSVDRVFLDTSPRRRNRAIAETPLAVALIIEYIAKNAAKIEKATDVPEDMRHVLEEWQGKDFATKIHFGPWPTEFATWPGHCPLPSDPNYNMYSDNTPNDRFVDNGDGTITDICTKLIWEQTPSAPPGSLRQGQNHCATLNPKPSQKRRKTDEGVGVDEPQTIWRAPTLIELQSILNYAAAYPALNPIFHEGNGQYWSSSPSGYKNKVRAVNFLAGYVYSDEPGENYRMRCVRGERAGRQTAGAKNHYAYAAAGETVTDNFTGAVWQRRVIDEERDHRQALNYCENLVVGGSRGWQLPTVKSLSTLTTLIDVTVGSPRINRDAFPGTPESWFWSSSPSVFREPGDPMAWLVDFSDGDVADERVDIIMFVGRCVR